MKKLDDESVRNRSANEKTYDDLKKMYQEQIEQQKKLYSNSSGDHDVIE